MAVDRADWHWDDAEKLYREVNGIGEGEKLTTEQESEIWLYAGNHIGQFFQWLIDCGFEGEEDDEEEADEVRKGNLTGTEYFIKYCDGTFSYDDVREDIQPFVRDYYESSKYFDDYADCCLDEDRPLYGVLTDWETFLKLKARIDKAYKDFLKNR